MAATTGKAEKNWRRPSLRLILSAVMVGLVLVVAAAIIGIGFVRARQTAVERVQERMNDFSDRLTSRLTIISNDTSTFVNIFATALGAFAAPPDERLPDKLTFAREALIRSPTVDGIFAGYEDGSFLHIVALHEYSWRKVLDAPKEAALAVRIADRRKDGSNIMRIFFLDASGKRLQAERVGQANFDPRQRPWYAAAKGGKTPVATGPYATAITGAFAMTISQAHARSPGTVIGADLLLNRVTDFVNEELLTPNSVVFVADSSGVPVIHSSKTVMQKIIAATREQAAETSSRADPLTRSLSRLLQAKDGRVEAVEVDGKTYVVMTSKLSTTLLFAGSTIVMAAPLDELLGPAYDLLFQGLIVAAGVVIIVVIAALVLAGMITRSLDRLTESAERLRELDFQASQDIASRVHEIHTLSGAMKQARDAISTFALYVPKELVRKGIESGEFSRRTASRQEVTAVFTDIYGFTTISEGHSPEAVVTMLSDYFDILHRTVNAHNGTIVQFLGDSIFAMWNAPVPDEDHAENACRAALAMRAALENFNAAQRERGQPEFRTRFGIHTGEAVVGSVGAVDRLQYTAMGDTINVASRLEGMNKEHGTTILASLAVHERCRDTILFRALGEGHAKGRREEIELYEVVGAEVVTGIDRSRAIA
ncbi:adenylate/guanylate cyclase domain-containing protein [Rhizobium sp.]